MATLQLRIDPRQMEQGADSAERSLRGVKIEARQVESAIDRMAAQGGRSTQRLGGAVRGMGTAMQSSRGQIQNAAFQLGDFATQVGAGTSASIALGQQLPQLLGGFGALGAVLGAVVAVGVPLAASFLSQAENAGVYEKRLKELRDTTQDLRDELALLMGGFDNLGQLEVSREITRLESERAAIVERMESAYGRNLRALELQRDAIDRQIAAQQALLDDYQDAKDSLEGTKVAAQGLYDTIESIDLSDVIVQADTLVNRFAKAAENAWQMAQNAASRIDAQGKIETDNLAAQYAQYGQGRQAADRLISERRYSADNRYSWQSPSSAVSGATGGASAANQIDQTRQAYERLMASLDPLVRASQQLAESQNTITKAQQAGIITAEQAAQAYGMAQEEYDQMVKDASSQTDGLSDAAQAASGAFSQLFDSIIQGGMEASDVLRDLALQLLKMGLSSAFPGLFGSSGWLSFDGGGYTGNGPRSGGMDGKGGFPALLHPNETVVDHTRAGNSNRGANMSVVVNNYAENTETRETRRQGPNGEELIIDVVNRGVVRGDMDKSFGGRYAVKQQRVAR